MSAAAIISRPAPMHAPWTQANTGLPHCVHQGVGVSEAKLSRSNVIKDFVAPDEIRQAIGTRYTVGREDLGKALTSSSHTPFR